MSTVTLGAAVLAGTFNFFASDNTHFPVHYIYPQDLNGDGVEEVIFAGFQSQPTTPLNYINTNVRIFGWQNGALNNITSQWLPNNIDNVQGVGDIAFGDFNGDGKIDALLSAYTDMFFDAHTYELINNGTSFTRVDLGLASWQHSVTSGDIDHDGYDDVYSTGYGGGADKIYFGSATGLTQGQDTFFGGSGVALGDFLGNGTTTLVSVDHAPGNATNSVLSAFIQNNGRLIPNPISNLPDSRFNIISLYGTPPDYAGLGHDVRVKPIDFDNDSKLDVIVFSRKRFDGTTWPKQSEVQFLRNTGQGNFVDVTDTVRVGYNTSSNVSYTPIFRDLNNDGLVDIFMSEVDYDVTNTSTSILLGNQDGTFVDTGRTTLSSAVQAGGGLSTVVKGPNGNNYLVSESFSNATPGTKVVSTRLLNISNTTPVVTPTPTPVVTPTPTPVGGGGGGGGVSTPTPVVIPVIVSEPTPTPVVTPTPTPVVTPTPTPVVTPTPTPVVTPVIVSEPTPTPVVTPTPTPVVTPVIVSTPVVNAPIFVAPAIVKSDIGNSLKVTVSNRTKGIVTIAQVDNTTMVVTAKPNVGRRFNGWTGACRGKNTVCVVPLVRKNMTTIAQFK